MREVDFSDRTVAQRWREIKPNLREDLIPWTRALLKRLLETSLEEELEIYLRAGQLERTAQRHAYRNRSYARAHCGWAPRTPELPPSQGRE